MFICTVRKIQQLTLLIFTAVLLCFTVLSPIHISAQNAVTVEKNETEDASVKENKEEAVTDSLYKYEEPSVEHVSYTWLLAKTLLILAVLGTAVYFTVRYLARKGGIQPVGKNIISTLSILPVGQNRQIQVVECGKSLLVLGVTDSRITLLKEINEKDEIDRIKLQTSKANSAAGDTSVKYFADHIESFIKSVGTAIGNAVDKKRSVSPASFRIREYEDEAAAPPQVPAEERKEGYSFFDDEKIDYLQKQKSRLKYMNRFEND